MGLGLHGGGLASARFFSERGADVTVTDLRTKEILAPSMEKLRDYPVRFVLGQHDVIDFKSADIVVKNPAVPGNSPYLQAAKQIETDISIFLQLYVGEVAAVTGSKGKSTTVSAMHHIIKTHHKNAKLGGNITVSPLDFLSEDTELDAPVILELSSWQLGDLRGKGVLKPKVGIITNILRDHQNRYASMNDYISDKMVLFEGMEREQTAIFNYDDPVLADLSRAVSAGLLYYSFQELPDLMDGGYLDTRRGIQRINGEEHVLFESTPLKGSHNRTNLLAAALGASCMGVPYKNIVSAAATFKGIKHRLEYVRTVGGVSFYNDSAATIPDASVAAALSFEQDVVLIMGGTDKELDFSCLSALKGEAREVYLLQGSATGKIIEVFEEAGIRYNGPFSSLQELLSSIIKDAVSGDIVLFSPGCTSFEMFLNEFDRGDTYKAMVEDLKG